MPDIVVLTGERGIGKSTVCRETVALAQGEGYACGGIITLAHDDRRDVVDVRSGERQRLTQGEESGTAVEQGRFRFDIQVLRWGNRTLTRATPCDLLVVDEIGPLELERGGGWANVFEALARGRFALAVVVVRPELVARARRRLPKKATMVLTVTEENRDQLAGTLLAMLREVG